MLSPLINSDIFTIIGYILGTLSGVLIGLSRILNYKLYREILCALSIYFYKARISPGLNIEEKDRTHKAIFSSNGSVFTRRNLTKLGGINNLENNPDLVLYEYKPRLFANLRERLFHSNTEIYE